MSSRSAKRALLSAKRALMSAKRASRPPKDTPYLPKELISQYAISEKLSHGNGADCSEKSPCIHQKSPDIRTKSPHICQKSPTIRQKRYHPNVPKMLTLRCRWLQSKKPDYLSKEPSHLPKEPNYLAKELISKYSQNTRLAMALTVV